MRGVQEGSTGVILSPGPACVRLAQLDRVVEMVVAEGAVVVKGGGGVGVEDG